MLITIKIILIALTAVCMILAVVGNFVDRIDIYRYFAYGIIFAAILGLIFLFEYIRIIEIITHLTKNAEWRTLSN